MRAARTTVVVLGAIVLLAILVVGGVALGGQVLSHDASPSAAKQVTGYRPTEAGLVVTVERGACDRVSSASARESDAEVVVTVRVEESERTCVGQAVQQQVPVTLDEPVGDRAVYDGPCLAGQAARIACRVKEKSLSRTGT